MEQAAVEKDDARGLESPKRLKLLAFSATTRGGNNLLHRLVQLNSDRDACASEDYLCAILRLFTEDLPVNGRNKVGYTALHLAVLKKSYHMLDKMLSCIVSLNVNAKTFSGETVLNMASKFAHRGIINSLIVKGANVNKKGYSGNSPLHCAIREGNLDIVPMLLDKGCNANARNGLGNTPLHIAVCCQCLNVCEMLVARGAYINARNIEGETPLHDAAWKTDTNFVKFLLWHGADVNAQDFRGRTPLHNAAYEGNHRLIDILKRRGADVNARSLNRKTPLHTASEVGNVDCVEALLRNGANIHARDSNNHTPLFLTVSQFTSSRLDKYREVIHLLLETDEDFSFRYNQSVSPLSLSILIDEILTEQT